MTDDPDIKINNKRAPRAYTSHFHIGGDLFSMLTGLCVYAWRRGDQWLYVGHSGNGLLRVVNHNIIGRVEEMGDEDTIEIWTFDEYQEAAAFENNLIECHVPRFNKTCEDGYGLGKRILRKINCPICHKDFFQKRWWQKFCSPQCRNPT